VAPIRAPPARPLLSVSQKHFLDIPAFPLHPFRAFDLAAKPGQAPTKGAETGLASRLSGDFPEKRVFQAFSTLSH
jgi:hypothetical protein